MVQKYLKNRLGNATVMFLLTSMYDRKFVVLSFQRCLFKTCERVFLPQQRLCSCISWRVQVSSVDYIALINLMSHWIIVFDIYFAAVGEKVPSRYNKWVICFKHCSDYLNLGPSSAIQQDYSQPTPPVIKLPPISVISHTELRHATPDTQ